MTRRQRARERRAYNRWRRWVLGMGDHEDVFSWSELCAETRDIRRHIARATGPRSMRRASAEAEHARNMEWAETVAWKPSDYNTWRFSDDGSGIEFL